MSLPWLSCYKTRVTGFQSHDYGALYKTPGQSERFISLAWWCQQLWRDSPCGKKLGQGFLVGEVGRLLGPKGGLQLSASKNQGPWPHGHKEMTSATTPGNLDVDLPPGEPPDEITTQPRSWLRFCRLSHRGPHWAIPGLLTNRTCEMINVYVALSGYVCANLLLSS